MLLHAPPFDSRVVRRALSCGLHAIVVRQLLDPALAPPRRDRYLLDCCATLGAVLPVDPRGTLVWEVRPRPQREASGSATISEARGECAAHTDQVYRPKPGNVVVLGCVRPASDGGASVLVQQGDVLTVLRSTAAGRRAEALLRSVPVPYLVPVPFREDPAVPEVHWARVLAGGCVRWRYDAVQDALVHCDLDDEALTAALEAMREAVEGAPATTVLLSPGDTLFARNDVLLHSRLYFADGRRRLLRAWVRAPLGALS